MTDKVLSTIRGLYTWWIRELARTLTARRAGPRGWSTLLLSTPEGLSVHVGSADASKEILRLEPDALPDEVEVLRRRALETANRDPKQILLRLSDSDVIDRTIQIPAAASDVIEPVLQNQMERIVPWPVDETRYGYQIVGANANAPDQLDVHVVATTRGVVDAALIRAEALGLTPYAVDFSSEPAALAGIVLHSLEADPLKRTAETLHVLLMLLLATSIAVGSFGFYSMFDRMAQSDDLTAKIAVAKSRAAELKQLNDENTRLKEQREYLVKRKTDEPAAILLIEAMSRALPDSAYLTELEIQGRETRIVGKSEDPTALITKLEDSAQFEDVRFAAPTTRQEGETLGTFSIIGRAQGGAALTERAP